MAQQPQTTEEYIEKVLRQAAQQQNEEVLTHQQIKRREDLKRHGYQQKLKFFSLVLVIILIAYILLKVIPWPSSEGQPSTEN